ncbi:PKD domain-containing protein [Ochrovirga pacifica]|uniref:PKD domain-containing protein n=1 Tax=Ochrovirga pacifica TaxID=1042376 RepID=UPI0002557792|nr:PKD domain-containing protein [Ochrovirga pacifica]
MNKIDIIKMQLSAVFMALTLFATTSCDSFEYDLPEANSKEDTTPPSASFSASVTEDYLTYTFGNTSSSATDYMWDYGDGNTSTGIDGENTFPGEGTFTVTLTAADKLGVTSTYSMEIEVVEPEIPAAITPEIINGDMDSGSPRDGWGWTTFTDGTTYPFGSTSDGSTLLIDGTDSGAKTGGAKFTKGTSGGIYRSSSSRYGGQAIVVSANRDYVLEYEYAIKNDDGLNTGAKIVVEILDGHFEDGKEAVDNAPRIITNEGTKLEGKGNFTKVTQNFTANATGNIMILFWGETQQDAYLDNVKVYPVE